MSPNTHGVDTPVPGFVADGASVGFVGPHQYRGMGAPGPDLRHRPATPRNPRLRRFRSGGRSPHRMAARCTRPSGRRPPPRGVGCPPLSRRRPFACGRHGAPARGHCHPGCRGHLRPRSGDHRPRPPLVANMTPTGSLSPGAISAVPYRCPGDQAGQHEA